MSSLHCPARVFVSRAGEAGALAERLRGERIAGIWTSPLALPTAELAAARLGTGVVVRDGLREGAEGEASAEVVARVELVLEEIADSHRGEAVLVVGLDTGLLDTGLLGRGLPGWGLLELEADDDGWRLVGGGAP